ncbi:hypothetical protein [Polluticoccus soli]|uniref:hypothetical protein n=1 Tax=Polluticoccus soli TaxID=3034150 RepID=UPI0023E2257D|nr:hypothetical protein [Flavipsychrobacter sp. JY13-12]
MNRSNSLDGKSFTLSKAIEVKNHFQYLVGNNYCGVGNIVALFVCPSERREELINEYKNHKIAKLNGGIFTSKGARREEEYEVIIMARVSHPAMTSKFEIFKDIRTYAVERQIHYRF